MAVHVFTSVTSNYLPKARVLAQSVKRNLPGCVFHLLLVDTVPLGFDLRNEPFDFLLSIEELAIPSAEQWIFQHSVVEACTGVKGFGLKRLLAMNDCDAVLYLDPDVVVLSPLQKLLECLNSSAVILTPHLTEPEVTVEAILDNEFAALRHGVYNLGFLGVGACAEGRRFADWWANRLEHFCYDDIPRGLFTDQRWVDLAPAYFEGLRIVRDPGYNVCTWNLTHRRVEGNLLDGLTVNGGPLYFYHFSGLDSGSQQTMLQRYGSEMPALLELREWYLTECDRMGQQQFENIPWSYGFFDNGERVRPLHRKLYREREDLRKAFPKPFSTGNVNCSYYHWFEANAGLGGPAGVEPEAPSSIVRRMEATSGKEPCRSRELHYRIYLSVCGADPAAAAAFAKDLPGRTYQRANLHLVGPPSMLDPLRQSEGPAGLLATLALPEGASHEQSFAAVVKECGGEWDFIFLTTDVAVPDLWDLRLAWTAERISGVATVSPINESSPWTRLGVASSLDGVDLIDRACHGYSLLRNPEIPEFLPDCFYVSRKAVRDALTRGTHPDTFRVFAEVCRRFRWSHVLADHIYTGTVRDRAAAQPSSGGGPLEELAVQVGDLLAGKVRTPRDSVRERAKGRQLHVLHSWGGGLDRWVAEYCRADRSHTNLILKSVGTWGAFGQELHLYGSIDDPNPIGRWALSPGIKHTATTHSGYQAALSEIVDRYGIDNILISSLVGHSLDALEAAPATLVAHDFYPFCPALNITFGSVCRHCTESDLQNCTEANIHHRFFRNVPPAEWLELRKEFSQRVLRGQVPIVAPSPSVPRHYAELAPELKGCFQVIPHGVRRFESGPLRLDHSSGKRLRVLILGSLAPQKGLDLLREAQDGLRSFADLYLVGCGEYGLEFEALSGVVVIPEYDWQELPGLLQSIRPDLGLLLSVVPETFSYTLQELMNLAIPPVATRIGSFADWIEDEVDGFLCDAEPAAVVARLEGLNARRDLLAGAHKQLRGRKQRTVLEMVADYERLLGLPALSARAYFDRGQQERPAAKGSVDFRLTWRTASGDFEESVGDSVAAGGIGSQVASIAIPELRAGTSELRLNLGNEPGFVVLLRIHLYSSEQRCLWSWDSRRGLPGGVWENIEALAIDPGLLLHLSAGGPRWLLPIGDTDLKALARGGHMEIESSSPSIEMLISSISASLLTNQTCESAQLQRETLRQLLLALGPTGRDRPSTRNTSSERLLQRLTDSQARVEELETSLSWRITAPLRWAGAKALKLSRRLGHANRARRG